MACPDQLVTKQDIANLSAQLSDLATYAQAEEILSRLGRVEAGTADTIPGAIASIFDSLISLVRDPIVAAINGTTDIINNGIDFLENIVTSTIKATENVLVAGINGIENVLVAGLETIQAGINGVTQIAISGFETVQTAINSALGAINAVRDIALAGFSALETLTEGVKAIVLEALSILRILPETIRDLLISNNLFLQKLLQDILAAPIAALSQGLESLIKTYFDALNDLLQRLLWSNDEQDLALNATLKELLKLVNAINSKLGGFPISCGNDSSIVGASLADALRYLICGRSKDGLDGINGTIYVGVGDGTNLPVENMDNRALLEAIANAIGVNEFPGTVPKSLLNSGDNPEGSGTTAIANLTQFILWIVKQMDALIGEFPIKMTIKDADLAAEGDQAVEVELKNIAETLAEIYGQSASGLIVQSAHTNFLARLSGEAVASKTSILIIQDLAQSIIDFLGFKNKKIKREAKSAFDLGREDASSIKSLSQILRQSSYNYQGFEFDDDAILLDYLPKFMFAASLIKAAMFRTDESDINSIERLAEEQLNDADNGWKQFVDEVNNPDSFFNLNEPDRPFIRDFKDEEPEQ